MRGCAYTRGVAAVTLGAEASTAGVSTSGATATVSGVFSTTASLSVGWLSSSLASSVSEAATSLISADLKAGFETRETSTSFAARTWITPLAGRESITSTPTLIPVFSPSLASISASDAFVDALSLKVPYHPSSDASID